jgi:DNA-binding MarR family transcriptional regulator
MTATLILHKMEKLNPVNARLELANQYVQYTNRNIFLTGKAGTGKTTFLKNLKHRTPKRIVVVAPTGVAAINAGGVTIHSFFQLPFGPFIPGLEPQRGMQEMRFSKDKIRTIRAMDLLVIDEISMVRADLLDGIDAVLRRFRNRSKPFGGVQVLMIGDLHQLAPVIREEEWELLKSYYPNVYFFESHALKLSMPLTLELTHIYRQEDENFIRLLNKIREKKLDQQDIEWLNSRYQPDFEPTGDDGYITLTTHNATAQSINQNRLLGLRGKIHSFQAVVEGEFPESAYPNDFRLDLKTGAQVMFIKNDASREKFYYNGKIGIVTGIREDEILVRCQGEDEIRVGRVSWPNIKYVLNENKQMEEQTLGTFTQFPLKLAWAITIHKSQGLTFDKAIIDAQASFAHGQVYVALSRCKTFEGLILSTPLNNQSIRTDHTIATFNEEARQAILDESTLYSARKNTQEEWIRDLFDFHALKKRLVFLNRLVEENKNHLVDSTVNTIHDLILKLDKEVMEIVEKFLLQLPNYLGQPVLPEENQALQERIQKGSAYLLSRLEGNWVETLSRLDLDCDNKEIKKTLHQAQDQLMQEVREKIQVFQACRTGFESTRYLQAKANAGLEPEIKKSPLKLPKEEKTNLEHADLYQVLKQWRDRMAEEKRLPVYMVLPQKAMKQISNLLPGNRDALVSIKGIGEQKLAQYGEQIIHLVTEYCRHHRLSPNYMVESHLNPSQKIPKGETQHKTYVLFSQGKTISEIARERELTVSTIENHLAKYIAMGLIEVEQIMAPDRISKLRAFIQSKTTALNKEIKEHFGEEFSYGEINMVRESLARSEQNKKA